MKLLILQSFHTQNDLRKENEFDEFIMVHVILYPSPPQVCVANDNLGSVTMNIIYLKSQIYTVIQHTMIGLRTMIVLCRSTPTLDVHNNW